MNFLQRSASSVALGLCYVLLFLTAVFYYPKWSIADTNATISWDVSGYYWYLPAIFIYDDLRDCDFRQQILDTYHPTPVFLQGYFDESGNCVMKYSSGLALQYLPAFGIAHLIASNSSAYPADGFSFPYQLAIGLHSLLIAFLGLLLLRRFLRYYFSEWSTALTLLILVFGTNYLTYGGISNAMTHNYLFTIYAGLLLLTRSFYRQPKLGTAIGIGLLVGLAALTRPTELMSALIPLLWGGQALRERLAFFQANWRSLVLAVVCCILVGSIQLIYWKYATGHWLVYSYEDQGFSWLSPHLGQGIFSYRSGWLTYSPILAFALLGFVPLYIYQRSHFWMAFSFSALFIYVTFAWDIWWYGGSVGQRAMVQAYPVLALPLAAFVQWVRRPQWLRWSLVTIGIVFTLYNLWITHQAHRGGLLAVGIMTKAYFWEILGTFERQEEDQKLLDTNEDYRGEREDVRVLFTTNFEADSIPSCDLPPLEGNRSLCLSKEHQKSPIFSFPLEAGVAEWVRVRADYFCEFKEWDNWRMAQLSTEFWQGDRRIKEKSIRLHRLLDNGERQHIWQDTRIPDEPFDRIAVSLRNNDGDKRLLVDQLTIEAFNESD